MFGSRISHRSVLNSGSGRPRPTSISFFLPLALSTVGASGVSFLNTPISSAQLHIFYAGPLPLITLMVYAPAGQYASLVGSYQKSGTRSLSVHSIIPR